MKKINIIITLSFLLQTCIAFGNMNKDSISNVAIPKLAIKILPTGMINFTEPSFQVSVEHQIFKNVNLQHTGGLIYNYESNNNANNYTYRNTTETKGFTARSEIRFYVNPNYSNYEGKYFGFDMMYKYIQQDKEKFFTRYDGAYDELLKFKRIKHVIGFHLLGGYQAQVGNSPFFLNLYGGLGIRTISIGVKDLPDDVYEYNLNDYYVFERENGSYLMPSLIGGLKIGFTFK